VQDDTEMKREEKESMNNSVYNWFNIILCYYVTILNQNIKWVAILIPV